MPWTTSIIAAPGEHRQPRTCSLEGPPAGVFIGFSGNRSTIDNWVTGPCRGLGALRRPRSTANRWHSPSGRPGRWSECRPVPCDSGGPVYFTLTLAIAVALRAPQDLAPHPRRSRPVDPGVRGEGRGCLDAALRLLRVHGGPLADRGPSTSARPPDGGRKPVRATVSTGNPILATRPRRSRNS